MIAHHHREEEDYAKACKQRIYEQIVTRLCLRGSRAGKFDIRAGRELETRNAFLCFLNKGIHGTARNITCNRLHAASAFV